MALRQMARQWYRYIEPDTGLKNGMAYRRDLERIVTSAGHAGLLYLDIDKLIDLNTRHTEPNVDRALVALGAFLRGLVASQRHCRGETYRVHGKGGDELAILMRCAEHIPALAQQVCDGVRATAFPPLAMGELTLSVGATTVREGDTAQSLEQRAASLKQRAKDSGRDRVETD